MHLAGKHVERDVSERRDRVVVLGDAGHRQRRLHGRAALRDERADGGFVDHVGLSRSPRLCAAAERRRTNLAMLPTSSPRFACDSRQLGGEVDVAGEGRPALHRVRLTGSSSPRRRATGSACSPASAAGGERHGPVDREACVVVLRGDGEELERGFWPMFFFQKHPSNCRPTWPARGSSGRSS